jgi:hypothetical protein
MVYKKYIKKNGKIYGPYDYQSKRVDGKVVSEYVGSKHNPKSINKLYVFLTVAALVIVLLVFLFFTLKSNFSGNIVSNIADSFKKTSVSEKSNIDPTTLTNQEKINSSKSIGDGIVQQTARNYKDWIIVTFKVGDNEIEYSYSNTLSKAELNSLIDKDKTNWLNSLSGK